MLNKLSIATGLLVSTLGLASAEAQFSNTHFDVTVLETDALVVATVESLTPAKDTPGFVRVSLSDVRTVWSRFESPVHAFLIQSELLPEQRVIRFGHGLRLTVGRRYVMFLRGGEDGQAPFVSTNVPIYRVVDGVVECSGGEVYAVGAFGLFCSTPERQAAAPMTEEHLAQVLQQRRSHARRRRPRRAAVEDSVLRRLFGNRAEQ